MPKQRPKRKELDPSNTKVEINMTPMIDMTFLVLVFFMLVCHFSAMEVEMIALPKASAAKEPEGTNPNIPIVVVNIKEEDPAAGHVTIHGRKYDKDMLGRYIAVEARRAGIDNSNPEYVKKKVSKLHVIVRCDKDAPYEAVQWVFEVCSMSKVIHIYISATPEELEET